LEEEIEKDAVCHRFYILNLYSEHFSKKSLEGFGDFKNRTSNSHCEKADNPVLLAKE
jgi:hypothetical protein